jgi:DNA polymerase III epsilon subunit-like protein
MVLDTYKKEDKKMNKHQTRDIIFIDTESTGIDTSRDTILEIGAVRYSPNGELLRSFERKIQPESPVSNEAARINGYSTLSWRAGIKFEVAMHHLYDDLVDQFPNKCIIISYFMFDRDIISNQSRSMQCPFYFKDIPWLNFADIAFPLVATGRVDSRRLEDLAEFFEINPGQKHRALSDAKTLASCYFLYLKRFNRSFLAGDVARVATDKVGKLFSKYFVPHVDE